MEKCKVVRKLVLCHKPMVLFIQECGVIRLLGGNLLSRGVGVATNGASGGLITLWNKELFTVKVCVSSDRCLVVIGDMSGIKRELVFCNIYMCQ